MQGADDYGVIIEGAAVKEIAGRSFHVGKGADAGPRYAPLVGATMAVEWDSVMMLYIMTPNEIEKLGKLMPTASSATATEE